MLVIRAQRMIDGSGSEPVRDAAVVVEGDRIVFAGPAQNLPEAAARAQAVNLGDATLLPGLIDAHVHLTMEPAPDPLGAAVGQPDGLSAVLAARHAWETLRAGFTTVRDAGGKNYMEFGVRDAIRSGRLSGSRILAAGKFLTMTGGRPNAGPYGREVDGADDARRGAREQLARGADLIKIMATGNVTSPNVHPGAQQLTEDEMRAAVEEAHKAGRKATAHAQGTEGIKAAVRAGMDSIDHAFYLDDEALDMMAERRVFMVPTLSAVYWILEAGPDAGIPQFILDKARAAAEAHIESFRRAVAHGVPIALGTDAGMPFNHHGRNAFEFRLMVEYGMTPMQAIVAGTSAAAECCGLEDLGLLRPGFIADIVAFAGDPSTDIRSLESRPVMVMQAGRIVTDAPVFPA